MPSLWVGSHPRIKCTEMYPGISRGSGQYGYDLEFVTKEGGGITDVFFRSWGRKQAVILGAVVN